MIKNIALKIYLVISSRKFFYATIGLFIIQAVWLAFTVQYPMAFDESYHMGIIQVYAHQWLPFITQEPPNASGFGVITRYDSYLYHYLMSFPYRIIDPLVSDWVAKVIIMRIINIGIFVGGLFLFRHLILRFHVSKALTNFSLLMLVLVPVVPVLAATINYDNLVFLLVPLVLSLALTCSTAITKDKQLPAKSFILFISIGFLASLTKYAFVPIFVGAILYLAIIWIRSRSNKVLVASFVASFKAIKRPVQIALIIIAIISSGLFVERYVGNLIMYHGFEPDCPQVKSLESCLTYGPWSRNYYLAEKVKMTDLPHNPSIPLYPLHWGSELVRKLYFTINYDFREYAPLPIPIAVASIIGTLGLLLILIFWRSILKIDRQLLLLAAVIVLYLAGVFYATFIAFIKYRTGVAINGRYLIIILPFIFVWLGLAYRQLFHIIFQARANNFIVIFSIIILLLALQGGGAMTYLLRSQPIWYWQNQPLININNNLKNIIAPFVVGGRDNS